MTTTIGIEELVDTNDVFEREGASWFAGSFVRGCRNFYDRITVTAFAAVAVGAMASAPTPSRSLEALAHAVPIASHQDSQWEASVEKLESLIHDMATGARSRFAAELQQQAVAALQGSRSRLSHEDAAWAKALALDVADLDD